MRRFLLFLLLCGGQSSSVAIDFAQFEQLADLSIRQTATGVAGDIDALIAMQEQLLEIGKRGAQDYLESDPGEHNKPLLLTFENADKMKTLSLEKIETEWHEGAYLASQGIDKDKIDHFGPVMSLMDAMIHPATAYIALQDYKKTGNPELLSRAKAELAEVLIHLNQLKSEPPVLSQNP